MEGGCVAKERKEIESVTESGTEKKRKMIYSREKTEHCDTGTHNVIWRNFEKSSSREINL